LPPNFVVIYKITTKTGGKIYIGSAANFHKRTLAHINLLTRLKHPNTILQNHVNKYGIKDLDFIILEIVMFKSDLINREQFYIDKFKPKLNIMKKAGSVLGYKHTDETKAKFIKAWTKRVRTSETGRKSGDAMRGRKLSPEHIMKIKAAKANISAETRAKMSLSSKGKKMSNEAKEKMRNNALGRRLPESAKQKLRDMWAARKKETNIYHSAETKMKISQSNKGRKHSEEIKQKMSIAAILRHKKTA